MTDTCDSELMESWLREVHELHDHFVAFFLGTTDSLDRVASVFAEDFTMVTPDGASPTRQQILDGIGAGHGHADSLTISISEAELLFKDDTTVVATYVESQQVNAKPATHRIATVVFAKDVSAPNGLLWRRVHETWMPAHGD